MHKNYMASLLTFVLLASACATTTTTSTMWTEPSAGPERERQGRVEWIRETVRQTEGNPAAGAATGAVVGGLLGGMITGRGLGALFGAAGGAMIGASESQGHSEDRTYDVSIRFDDGAAHIFRYRGHPPFQPGQSVSLTPRGLVARDTFVESSPHAAAPTPPSPQSQAGSGDSAAQPSTPQPKDIPSPPPATTPTPPAGQSQAEQPSVPDGQWAFTEQYGWVWMPYGAAYMFTPDYENGDPYMYVYYPAAGWNWVVAPWLWGFGPMPFFGAAGGVNFAWYGHGWGEGWHGDRSVHYRGGFGAGHGSGGRHH